MKILLNKKSMNILIYGINQVDQNVKQKKKQKKMKIMVVVVQEKNRQYNQKKMDVNEHVHRMMKHKLKIQILIRILLLLIRQHFLNVVQVQYQNWKNHGLLNHLNVQLNVHVKKLKLKLLHVQHVKLKVKHRHKILFNRI